MKILITGSNGLLGQKLVRLILGHPEIELIATSRGENRLPFAGSYVYQPMNITQKDEVENTLKAYAPDVVINTAAMTHVDQCETEQEACWKLNVEAVDYLVQACEKQDIFLLHLSTDFIFDGQAGPYDEKAAPNPISFYGESKLAAEKLIRSSSARWAIARTVLVYGLAHDMSRSNIVLWVKNSLEQGKELRIVNDQWRTPTLAEDLAQGCFLIARQQAGGIFNLSGEELMTPYDMAMLVCEFFNLPKEKITEVDAKTFSQPAKRPARTGFDISKAKKQLGYRPHTFREGINILNKQLISK